MTKVRLNCGAAPEGCAVELFSVWNTSHKELLVLARDRVRALQIASSANHFYSLGSERKDQNYPRADVIKQPFGKYSNCWNVIQHAVASRIEGTVHIEGDVVAVGYEIVAQ